MSSFLDKHRIGEPEYLVYYEKGEIKVRKGWAEKGEIEIYNTYKRNFYPADKDTWLTTCPIAYMEMNSKGRVLVKNEEDIPKAKQMIYEYYISKIKEIEQSVKEGVVK